MKPLLSSSIVCLLSIGTVTISLSEKTNVTLSTPSNMIAAIREIAPEVNEAILSRILQTKKGASAELQTLLNDYFIDAIHKNNVDKSIKEIRFGLFKDGIKFGNVSIEKYESFKDEDIGAGGLSIELNINLKTDPFEEYQWKQVVWTNYSALDGKVRAFVDPENLDEAEGECIKPFFWTEKQHAKFPKHFSDQPSRSFDLLPIRLSDGKLTNRLWWEGELSLYGITDGVEMRLLTIQYGFDLLKEDGKNITKLDAIRQKIKSSLIFRRAIYKFMKQYGAKC